VYQLVNKKVDNWNTFKNSVRAAKYTHDVHITRRNRFVLHSKIVAICSQTVQNTDKHSVGRRCMDIFMFNPGGRQRVDFTRLVLKGKYANVRLIRIYQRML
jgi:hypothetical protein